MANGGAEARRSLRELMISAEGVVAPLVLNALMARLADRSGFSAGYVGGGALGFLNAATEANLTLTELTQLGVAMRAESSLPLICDGTCGFGDPMHVRHTIRAVEAAGFSAIEIEDQLLPKRAHHHVGVEHLIPHELMTAKIAEAVAARHSPEFLIIARTNAARVETLDEALNRAESFHLAGADVLLVMPRRPEELPVIAARLPKPLMFMVPTSGITAIGMTRKELVQLGFSLIVDPVTPILALHAALRKCYAALAAGDADPIVGANGDAEEQLIHEAIDLEGLLAIERRTVERQGPLSNASEPLA